LPSDYHLFLHLKKFLGGKRFDDDDDLKDAAQKWLTSHRIASHRIASPSMRRVYKNLCLATINASIVAANMLKNSLNNVESDKNKILYETLLNFFYSETVLTF
jgi:hypothetical protein